MFQIEVRRLIKKPALIMCNLSRVIYGDRFFKLTRNKLSNNVSISLSTQYLVSIQYISGTAC